MKSIKKLYYSIGEAAEMLGEEPHVLRYWETEFKQLAPKKNRAGNRVYTEHDLEVLREIHGLLRVDKFTIEGARQALATKDRRHGAEERRKLLAVRAFLEDLLQRL